jgi:hypothetical protein
MKMKTMYDLTEGFKDKAGALYPESMIYAIMTCEGKTEIAMNTETSDFPGFLRIITNLLEKGLSETESVTTDTTH